MAEKLLERLVKKLGEMPADKWKATRGQYNDDGKNRKCDNYVTDLGGINISVIKMEFTEATDKYVIDAKDSLTKMMKKFPETPESEIRCLYETIRKSISDESQRKLIEEKRKREAAEKEFEDRLWGILDG